MKMCVATCCVFAVLRTYHGLDELQLATTRWRALTLPTCETPRRITEVRFPSVLIVLTSAPRTGPVQWQPIARAAAGLAALLAKASTCAEAPRLATRALPYVTRRPSTPQDLDGDATLAGPLGRHDDTGSMPVYT